MRRIDRRLERITAAEDESILEAAQDQPLDEQAAADAWWKALPWPGPFKMSVLVNASPEERLERYRKHGPDGPQAFPDAWQNGTRGTFKPREIETD